MRVNMLEAKNNLSRLVKAAIDGEEVVIARDGAPMVRLVPVAAQVGLKGWGRLRRLAAGLDAAFTPRVEEEVARSLARRR